MCFPAKVSLVFAAQSLFVVAFAGWQSAAANHIPGATYNGTHTAGGTMSFRISASGSGVEHFEFTGCPCGFSLVSSSIDFTPPVPIDETHSFSRSGTGIQRTTLAGSFPTAGEAIGTLRYQQTNIPFVQPGCDSGILNWTASVAGPGIPGDYNEDNTVDAADYTIWRDRLGEATSLPNDDTAGVGADDYTRWITHFGESGGSGATAVSLAAVPEPAAGSMLFAGFVSMLAMRRSAKSA
jgi:hypothetical protein